ncbi:hypothetical protein Tco_1144610 [Tanacetum coccineum]
MCPRPLRANFNQANSGYRPPRVTNQFDPPVFPPIQNPHAIVKTISIEEITSIQNRGNNFNQFRCKTSGQSTIAHQRTAPRHTVESKTEYERICHKHNVPLSTSGSGNSPGNTVTNPKEDLKGITTRSGVTIQGPKAVNHDDEVTKDTMPPANNGSTEDVQPPVVQIQTRNPNPEPKCFAPVVYSSS